MNIVFIKIGKFLRILKEYILINMTLLEGITWLCYLPLEVAVIWALRGDGSKWPNPCNSPFAMRRILDQGRPGFS